MVVTKISFFIYLSYLWKVRR